MKNCQKLVLIFLAILDYCTLQAQNPHSQNTQLEIGVGFILPFFNKGTELLRAEDLREAQQSYYIDEIGNRRNVGAYSRPSGFNYFIGFYKPVKGVKGLMMGAIVKNAQTGSTPSDGGYEEAYFFNFITAGLGLKYYPLNSYNLFLKSDFGVAAVLTKNRFVTSQKEQQYFHQFGIGSSLGLELGYSLSLFKKENYIIDVKSGFQVARTRVEVNGIGDDNWQFGAMYFGTSFNF